MAHNTITTPNSSSSYTEQRSAGNAIAENSDLIAQILVRLPVKPLTQFKSVSKQWLSLISDSQFSLHHSRRNRKPISALFLLSLNKINPEFSFLPFADCSLGSPHFQFLVHPGTSILHSCNGLLCFPKLDDTTESSILRYYVCNPTTKRSARIPLLGLVHNCRIRRGYFRVDHKLCNVKIEESTRPGNDLNINLLGIYVAFDPLKSQNYRVVCVWESNADLFNYEIRIAVYRSEIGLWGELMGAFTIPYAVCFNNGVFWNGEVHWISNSDIVCFDIDEGYLKIMPLPLTSNGSNVVYFGESNGHLHLVVNVKGSEVLLNVFEMETDYSRWVLKYCCDLDTVIIPPDMVLNHKSCAFSLIFLGRGEKEDESCLVIEIHGKLISYNLKNKTSKKLIDLLPFCYKNGWAQRSHYKALPYNETLFEV
ncbi:F-box protein [Camellia lanceoleosa]|uniref:F-box protein n=1 Tax=Camellia lanceoleosa TaxID=1840588 RepID=A0ACC0HV11_9ERIC|nr:F-box protein [Camellia lanceoleosa]